VQVEILLEITGAHGYCYTVGSCMMHTLVLEGEVSEGRYLGNIKPNLKGLFVDLYG
jgi:hypothetical protein